MLASRFQLGERVRARVSTTYFRKGQVGTVSTVLLPAKTVYLVQFDELPLPELAHESMLEREEPPPPRSAEHWPFVVADSEAPAEEAGALLWAWARSPYAPIGVPKSVLLEK